MPVNYLDPNKIFFGLAILVIGLLAGWFAMGWIFPGSTNRQSPINREIPKGIVGNTPLPSPSYPRIMDEAGLGDVTPTSGESKGGTKARTVVTYGTAGFQPPTVTIKVGETVTFINDTQNPMWVASNTHPGHDILPSFDQKTSVGKGGSYEYTFTDVGTWRYHNHSNHLEEGTVVVTN